MKHFRYPSRSDPVSGKPALGDDEVLSRLRLLRSRRVGPATWHRLMGEHATAEAALGALSAVAREAGIDGYAPCPVAVAAKELRAGVRAGAVPVFSDDPRYPQALASIVDAPPLLWVRGDFSALSRPAVAIAGARAASSLGTRMARRLGIDLAERGLCIVSGLARGIDAAAHLGALEAGGRTVAVLAGGVDTIYPSEHADLAARIAAEGGALVSEAPMGRTARSADFPKRNRIVTGLSLGAIIVEAALRSGSLATARLAAEQGREVMAIPGHPLEARAAGPNALIRDGATLIRCAADVIEALGGENALLRPENGSGATRSRTDAPTGAVQAGRGSESRQNEQVRGAVYAAPEAEGSPEIEAQVSFALPSAPGGERRDPLFADQPKNADDRSALHARIRSSLHAPLAEDDLIRSLGLPLAVLAPELLALELEGRIERLPGARLVAR